MIEVHHLNNSRSQRILWLLEELGMAYTIVPYSRDPRTRFAPPELKAIHPLGKSPVIRDGALVEITEGLDDGDVVVSKAGAFVRAGDRINPVPASGNTN